MSERTAATARGVLRGRRRGIGDYLAFGGPAVIASIAYMDPGNFATNIQAGAKYGYELLWVVLLANLIAMMFQALSAKLGIVTGRNLAEMCREQFSRPVTFVMWVVSEIAAMATDLAEFLGGAIGLALLFKMPLLTGMVITAIVTYGILMFESRGFRPVELIISSLVAVIALCYLIEIFIAPVDWKTAAIHTVTPQIADGEALLLAVGIIGATVMPHAVYLHSGLTQARIPARNNAEKRAVVRISNWEVLIALAVAGLVNMAMVMLASSAFHAGHSDVAEIETAYHILAPLLGIGAAGIFLLSLIASGISSSVVGTMAGQIDDARIHRVSYPDLVAARYYNGPCLCRRRDGRQRDQCSGHQPGGFEHSAAVADDRAGAVHAPPRYHGRVRQHAIDQCCCRGRHFDHPGAECGADFAQLRCAFAGALALHAAPA